MTPPLKIHVLFVPAIHWLPPYFAPPTAIAKQTFALFWCFIGAFRLSQRNRENTGHAAFINHSFIIHIAVHPPPRTGCQATDRPRPKRKKQFNNNIWLSPNFVGFPTHSSMIFLLLPDDNLLDGYCESSQPPFIGEPIFESFIFLSPPLPRGRNLIYSSPTSRGICALDKEL